MIYKLLQKTVYRKYRVFLKKVLNSFELSNLVKKIIVFPILYIVFRSVTELIEVNPENYYSININSIANIDKCTEKGLSITNNNWKQEISLINDSNNIKEYIIFVIELIYKSDINLMNTIFGTKFTSLDAFTEFIIEKINDQETRFMQKAIENFNNLLIIFLTVVAK